MKFRRSLQLTIAWFSFPPGLLFFLPVPFLVFFVFLRWIDKTFPIEWSHVSWTENFLLFYNSYSVQLFTVYSADFAELCSCVLLAAIFSPNLRGSVAKGRGLLEFLKYSVLYKIIVYVVLFYFICKIWKIFVWV